jgi:hypothetical protein
MRAILAVAITATYLSLAAGPVFAETIIQTSHTPVTTDSIRTVPHSRAVAASAEIGSSKGPAAVRKGGDFPSWLPPY